MKIGILSDTHGKQSLMDKAIANLGPIDILIHLGDHCSDAAALEEKLGIQVIYIKGNCDFCSDVPDSKLVELDGKIFFLTHGHLFDVNQGLDRLIYKGKELKADVILFGHTHIPEVFFHEDMLILNPGSASSPKVGKKLTAGIIHTIDDKLIPYIVNLND